MMKRVRTRKTLILDLRGNPGGTVSMEQRLLGYFFDRDVKIGDERLRNKTSTVTAKTRGADKIFSGKVIVLVDTKSASAAEVFARVMQLEKRGTVIGDHTAGAVMTGVMATFPFKTAADWQAIPSSFYGASITIADLIMSDGKSLEKDGVTPDMVLLPSGQDLAARRDPVLARAASLAGAQLDAEKAGTVFPPAQTDEEENEGAKDKH
jgi:C-terminal processing protease CtpA/Prc